jgi:antitoxin CcdA
MDMEATAVKVRKRVANVSIDADILDSAKAFAVNISQAAERGVAQAVAQKQAEQWLRDNQAALDSSNAFVERHGLPLAKYRPF